jgi:sporulation protein YlmC with PRC-barrel domain
MKLNLILLAGAVLVGPVALPVWAQPLPTNNPADLGTQKDLSRLVDIEVKNFQDETLGRVRDLGIDLANGKIIEVLVASGTFLGMGGKTTAVPPKALFADTSAGCYRLNVSAELFTSAPAVDLSTWNDVNHGRRIAAAYRLFGQEPYFLEVGATSGTTVGGHPKVPMGYVERSSKILDMPVGNHQNDQFGKVFSLTMDIPMGRILNVIISQEGNFQEKSIVPAMALSFNDKRDALVIDDSKAKFADEPRYNFTTSTVVGLPDTAEEEAYVGPHTDVSLVQGTSYRDVDRTVLINHNIRAAKINARNVEVGTINGRVTLRGQVATEDDRRQIGEIAIAASRLELVDNQITVGESGAAVKPVTLNN